MTHESTNPVAASTGAHRPHRVCELRGVTLSYTERVVLRDIDLVVGPTARFAVVGDNGSGKSTLLAALAGTKSTAAGERRVELPGGMAYAE